MTLSIGTTTTSALLSAAGKVSSYPFCAVPPLAGGAPGPARPDDPDPQLLPRRRQAFAAGRRRAGGDGQIGDRSGHAIEDRPVARDGAVVIRPMMYVALTYDHRVVDGREAVTFLKRIKDVIEDPPRMLLEI